MSEQALEQRLARLEASDAIRNLIGLYAVGADRRNDPAIFGMLYAEEAVWESAGFGRFEGRTRITQELARLGREQVLWSLHVMANPLIDIALDGAHAEARWVLWELASIGNGEGQGNDHWLGGQYHCDVVRTAEGWRFSHVRLHLALLSPYGEGFQRPG